jgi:hypothetical protein
VNTATTDTRQEAIDEAHIAALDASSAYITMRSLTPKQGEVAFGSLQAWREAITRCYDELMRANAAHCALAYAGIPEIRIDMAQIAKPIDGARSGRNWTGD